MRLLVLTLLLLLRLGIAFSQESPPDSLSKKELRKWEKAHNIHDLSDQLSLKIFLTGKSNQIKHHDGFTRRDIEYKPNEKTNLGFGFGYKWLGLDLTFNNRSKDDHVFGKTKRFDIISSFYLHKFVIDGGYKWYRGYYGSNPSEYNYTPPSNSSNYPIRPDITTRSFDLSALYILNNEKFSYRHAFTFNEIQKRSMGSFLVGVYFSTFEVNADSTLIPIEVRDVFDTTADFRGTRYINTGVSVGYAYNLILFKHAYISASFSLGAGPILENIPEINGNPARREIDSSSFGLIRMAMGYNGHKWYGGFTFKIITTGAEDQTESFVQRDFSSFQIHFGHRIKPPKVLKKLL